MTQPVSEPMTDIAYSIIDAIFGWIEPRDFAIRLWDGNMWGPDADLEPSSTVVLRRPSALRRMLMKPTEENFAECYISGEFDLEGDLEATVRLYLSAVANWFGRGYIRVFQSLFVKQTDEGKAHLPLNRFDWYEEAPVTLPWKDRRA